MSLNLTVELNQGATFTRKLGEALSEAIKGGNVEKATEIAVDGESAVNAYIVAITSLVPKNIGSFPTSGAFNQLAWVMEHVSLLGTLFGGDPFAPARKTLDEIAAKYNFSYK